MRTNLPGFALTVGMGLIVILLGLGALSMAGLVSLMPAEAFATEQQMPANEDPLIPKNEVGAVNTGKPASAAEVSAIAAGDALFKSNCTQCHAVNEKIVGPALAGITQRRSMAWLVPWVHNPAKVIASGDAYAVKLFDDYSKQQMPSFPQLSKKDIENIIAYVSTQNGVDDGNALAQVDATVQ
jgi:mono/diheme cytochrome c family protein